MARGSPSRPPVRTRFGGIKFDVARSEVPAAARTPIQAAPPPRPKAEPKAAAKQARCPANSFPAIASRCRSRCGADRCATAAQEGKPRPKSQSIAASFAAKPSGSRCGPCSLARSSPDPGLERSRLNRRVTSAARHAAPRPASPSLPARRRQRRPRRRKRARRASRTSSRRVQRHPRRCTYTQPRQCWLRLHSRRFSQFRRAAAWCCPCGCTVLKC